MHATGTFGACVVGYQRAAELGQWKLAPGEQALGVVRHTLRARITTYDSFWITQSPLTVWLRIGNSRPRWWKWVNAEVAFEDTRLVFTLKGKPIITKEGP